MQTILKKLFKHLKLKRFGYILALGLSMGSLPFTELADPTRPPAFLAKEASNAQPITWNLTAILISKERRVAVINGQLIKINDEINGGRVIAIQPNSVQIESANGRITLFLLDKTIKRLAK